MIIKFSDDVKATDLLRVAEFIEKQKIPYELISTPTEAYLAPAAAQAAAPAVSGDLHPDDMAPPRQTPIDDNRIKQTPRENDPLWNAALHDGNVCNDFDCKRIEHYGGMAL